MPTKKKEKTEKPMDGEKVLEKIFGSRTRVKLFRLFFNSPGQEFFVREISRTVDEQINSVRRELGNLEKIGLLKSETKNQKKFYHVDDSFELYQELKSLVLKASLHLEKEFFNALADEGPIEFLALTGYFVSDNESDIDVFIVGSISKEKLQKMLDSFHSTFDRQLRFTAMKHEEYKYRKEITDKFLHKILNGEKIVIIDKMS
jgi:predicted transcriptional regulator/acylphosphatase